MKNLDHLTELEFEVTQNACTEPPFKNKYWDNFKEGIYFDVVDGKALFHSKDKFESHCGWPSFMAPIEESAVRYVEDLSHGMNRIEVVSTSSNAHLGHVFNDGPKPRGLRFCINSASLKFTPRDELSLEDKKKYFN